MGISEKKIEKWENKNDIKNLIKALEYKEISIRIAAIKSLGNLKDEQVIIPLILCLGNSETQKHAYNSLINCEVLTTNVLYKILENQNNPNFQALLNFMKQVGPLLVIFLANDSTYPSSENNELAGRFLAVIGQPIVFPITKTIQQANNANTSLLGVLTYIGDLALEPAIAGLENKNDKIRETCAKVLGNIGDHIAVTSLIKCLNDDEGNVISAAISSLGESKDNQAVKALGQFLLNRGEKEWDWGKWDDYMRYDLWYNRSPVEMGNDDWFQYRRGHAAQVLEHIGSPEAIEYLVKAIKYNPKYVGQHIASALESLGWHPTNDESGAWYYLIKNNISKCINCGKDAINPLIFSLLEPVVEKWRSAIKALENIATEREEQLLCDILLHTKSQNMAEAIIEMFGNMKSEKSIDCLKKILSESKEFNLNRDIVIKALNSIGTEKAMAVVKKYE